jgi:hypothetical protein
VQVRAILLWTWPTKPKLGTEREPVGYDIDKWSFNKMKKVLSQIATASVLASVAAFVIAASAAPAAAKGCIKGAVVGGVAGHVAGHHGVLGAAAGCAIGHHEASKHDKANQNPPPKSQQ